MNEAGKVFSGRCRKRKHGLNQVAGGALMGLGNAEVAAPVPHQCIMEAKCGEEPFCLSNLLCYAKICANMPGQWVASSW